MTRSYDWSPIGLYRDPVPGEPEVLVSQVSKYRNIANNIKSAASGLDSIVHSSTASGEFAEAFAEQADEVIGRINKAKLKYDGFADAINDYIPPLRDARQKSYDLLVLARGARDDLDDAENALRIWYQKLYDSDTDPADLSLIQRKVEELEDSAATARQRVQAHAESIIAVISDLQKAAQAAADAIKHTGDSSGINDSGWVQFWEEYGGWFDTALNVLGTIAAIALVIALVIPGLNVLVGAILVIGVIIAAAVALNAVLQASAGTKSLTDAVIEIALALIPLGIGKFVRPAASLVQAGMKAGKPALMASSSALGIRGVTGASAASAIEHLVARAKPAWWLKAVLGSADELAQVQAIRNLTVGPSTLINGVFKGQMWKLGLEGSPLLDIAIETHLGDMLKDGVGALAGNDPLGGNRVHQSSSW